MKKVLVIPTLLCVFFLTGCDQNRLVCTQTAEDVSNIKKETKYVFNFNNDKVKKATMTTEITLKGNYNNKSFIDSYAQMATSAVTGYSEVSGVQATSHVKKNIITLKVEMDPNLMTKDAVESYGLNSNKEALKDELEDMGYTCK